MLEQGPTPSGGWILVRREWFYSEDFRPDPFPDLLAYVWSMQQAAFAPHERWFNGRQYHLDIGQFVTSHHKMAQTFGWSEKRVRLFSQRMVRRGRWAIGRAGTGAKSPTLITICNYLHFQRRVQAGGEEYGEVSDEVGTHRRRSAGTQDKDDKRSQRKEKKEKPFKSTSPRLIGETFGELGSIPRAVGNFGGNSTTFGQYKRKGRWDSFSPEQQVEIFGQVP